MIVTESATVVSVVERVAVTTHIEMAEAKAACEDLEVREALVERTLLVVANELRNYFRTEAAAEIAAVEAARK